MFKQILATTLLATSVLTVAPANAGLRDNMNQHNQQVASEKVEHLKVCKQVLRDAQYTYQRGYYDDFTQMYVDTNNDIWEVSGGNSKFNHFGLSVYNDAIRFDECEYQWVGKVGETRTFGSGKKVEFHVEGSNLVKYTQYESGNYGDPITLVPATNQIRNYCINQHYMGGRGHTKTDIDVKYQAKAERCMRTNGKGNNPMDFTNIYADPGLDYYYHNITNDVPSSNILSISF